MSETTQAAVAERTPANLSEVLDDLQGFGIEECEEILTVTSGKRTMRFKFSNISTDEDLQSNLATEEAKGYEHFQRIKAEILSRAISWINGVDLRALEGPSRLVLDPTTGDKVDFRAGLRRTILSWGVEVMQVMWKMLMVHVQSIEDRLFESLPDDAVMTQVEIRYRDRMAKELEEITRDTLSQRIGELIDQEPPEETAEEAPAS